MYLNRLKPAVGAKQAAKRVGRGIGCGLGKTCGRGHKGQSARAGGFHKVGFEGGQMPLQRRLPKIGFTSLKARLTTEVCLHQLDRVAAEIIELAHLKESNIVPQYCQRAKVIASGKLTKAVVIRGIAVTPGARSAIEAAGGRVEE